MSLGLPLPNTPEAGDRPWGVHLVLDLYECDPDKLRDPEFLRAFAADVVKHVGMVTFGDPWCARFAEHDPALVGITLFQPITTSNVLVHAVEGDNAVCVDLFSCQPFDADDAARYIAGYFGAKRRVQHVIPRLAQRGR